MKKELTCIVCPLGCTVTVDIVDEKIASISGFSCKRGREYAENECTDPRRIITTTVRCKDGTILPVKTDRPIPKNKIFEAMRIINAAAPVLPISIGDVIIEDVFGSNVIATKNEP